MRKSLIMKNLEAYLDRNIDFVNNFYYKKSSDQTNVIINTVTPISRNNSTTIPIKDLDKDPEDMEKFLNSILKFIK